MDYQLRGEALGVKNVIDFFVDSYEEPVNKYKKSQRNEDDNADSDAHRRPRGSRRLHERVKYLAEHPSYNTMHRVVRPAGHNTLPNFIGRYFPRRDDPDIQPFYCASMLALLKPWRHLETDLKKPTETWTEAFEVFMSTAPKRVKDILSGIQYFHECSSAAQKARENPDYSLPTYQQRVHGDDEYDHVLPEDAHPVEAELSEEGLVALQAQQMSWNEEVHGLHAVEQAKHAKIFSNEEVQWAVSENSPVGNATADDLVKLLEWQAQMNMDVNTQNVRPNIPGTNSPEDTEAADGAGVSRLHEDLTGSAGITHIAPDEISEEALTGVHPSELKPDQYRAYDIVAWHLEQTLAGKEPPPLRLIIHGEGGTGKSKVIQTITEFFAQRGAKHLLLKAAYTGVAASLINGKTTHSIGFITPQTMKNLSNETKAKLQAFWRSYTYLIIDEISMIGKTFLAALSRHISIGKDRPDSGAAGGGRSFGGINVIFCGDFHQFPPVAVGASEVLYHPTNLARDSLDAQLGRSIYEEFTTVVVLREQVRVTDGVWRDFLSHLRVGRVQEQHLQMLRTLVITNPSCPKTDFTVDPWNNAFLVTPRHGVRRLWNDAACRKHCQETGARLFICTAEDTIKGEPLSLRQRYAVASRAASKGSRYRKHDLPNTVQIAVGMKVMVTQNVETDLDITNGARGVIVDIILDPEEPPLDNSAVVKLQRPPSYLLVKLNRTRASKLAGLDESVIPISTRQQTFRISYNTTEGKETTRTVRRRQYPVTSAYSFTDYRAQGQTLPFVLIDIATPPTGTLTLFNLYVALSRSSGRESIRLLRDFKDELFMASHDTLLLAEDDRLDELDRTTKAMCIKLGRGYVHRDK